MDAQHPALKRLTGEKHPHHRALLEYLDCRNQAETARRTGLALSTVRWLRGRWNWDARIEQWDNAQEAAEREANSAAMRLTREGARLMDEARKRADLLSEVADLGLQVARRELRAALEEGKQVQLSSVNALVGTCTKAVSQCREETGVGELIQQLSDQLHSETDSKPGKWSGHRS